MFRDAEPPKITADQSTPVERCIVGGGLAACIAAIEASKRGVDIASSTAEANQA